MCSLAIDINAKAIAGAHEWSGSHAKAADGAPRCIVQTKDRIAVKALKQTVLNHGASAGLSAFLSGLENTVQRAVKLAALG